MIINGNQNRISIEITKVEALCLIAELAKAVNHFDAVGGAYFSGPCIGEDQAGNQSAGRYTIRIEEE